MGNDPVGLLAVALILASRDAAAARTLIHVIHWPLKELSEETGRMRAESMIRLARLYRKTTGML
jgi:hypothetical protein